MLVIEILAIQLKTSRRWAIEGENIICCVSFAKKKERKIALPYLINTSKSSINKAKTEEKYLVRKSSFLFFGGINAVEHGYNVTCVATWREEAVPRVVRIIPVEI